MQKKYQSVAPIAAFLHFSSFFLYWPNLGMHNFFEGHKDRLHLNFLYERLIAKGYLIKIKPRKTIHRHFLHITQINFVKSANQKLIPKFTRNVFYKQSISVLDTGGY